MNGKSKLTRQQHEQQQQEQQHEAQTQARQEQEATSREFSTVEEMLRFDAAQTPVPGTVAQRLQNSVERENLNTALPWWKRLLGK